MFCQDLIQTCQPFIFTDTTQVFQFKNLEQYKIFDTIDLICSFTDIHKLTEHTFSQRIFRIEWNREMNETEMPTLLSLYRLYTSFLYAYIQNIAINIFVWWREEDANRCSIYVYLKIDRNCAHMS